MNKYPFSKITSLLSYDFTFKVDDSTEYTIPAGVPSAAAEPKISYTTNDIGAWKTSADTSEKDYIAVFERASRKKTTGLPDYDETQNILYLVPADVCAVGRKIEKRKDLVTPADLIRARYKDNRYIRFLKESAIPANS